MLSPSDVDEICSLSIDVQVLPQYNVGVVLGSFLCLLKVKIFGFGANSLCNAETLETQPVSVFPCALIFFLGIL